MRLDTHPPSPVPRCDFHMLDYSQLSDLLLLALVLAICLSYCQC